MPARSSSHSCCNRAATCLSTSICLLLGHSRLKPRVRQLPALHASAKLALQPTARGPVPRWPGERGRTPGVLGLHFGKAHVLSWRIVLGSRGARPRPPAPPPGDAPLLSPPPTLAAGTGFRRSLQAVCLGARLIFWFGEWRRFWFGDRSQVLTSSRPTKTGGPSLDPSVKKAEMSCRLPAGSAAGLPTLRAQPPHGMHTQLHSTG